MGNQTFVHLQSVVKHTWTSLFSARKWPTSFDWIARKMHSIAISTVLQSKWRNMKIVVGLEEQTNACNGYGTDLSTSSLEYRLIQVWRLCLDLRVLTFCFTRTPGMAQHRSRISKSLATTNCTTWFVPTLAPFLVRGRSREGQLGLWFEDNRGYGMMNKRIIYQNIIWFNIAFRGIRKRTFVNVHEKLQFMNWRLTCSFLSWHSVQAKKLLWLLLGQLPAIRNVLRNLPTSENLFEKYTIDACPQEPTAPGPIQGPPKTWALVKADIVHHIQLIDLNWIESRALSFSNMWHGGWYGFLNRISPILRNRTIESWDVLNWLSTLRSDRQTLMITRSGYGEVYGSGWEAMYWWCLDANRAVTNGSNQEHTLKTHLYSTCLIRQAWQCIAIVLPASPFKSAWNLSQEHKYKCVPRSFSYKSLAGGAAWNRWTR